MLRLNLRTTKVHTYRADRFNEIFMLDRRENGILAKNTPVEWFENLQSCRTEFLRVVTNADMARVFGISQYFIKRNNRSHNLLLTAELSEDFLVPGKLNDINDFSTALK